MMHLRPSQLMQLKLLLLHLPRLMRLLLLRPQNLLQK
jgi:hypothetical protein